MKYIVTVCLGLSLLACTNKKNKFDAQGIFEADEVIVSSELPGRITSLTVQEGDTIMAGALVGKVDSIPLSLQKEQVQASIQALNQKTTDAAPQLKLLQDQLTVQETQLQNVSQEKTRIERLLKQDAATGKQLDDINFQLEALKKQMLVTKQQMAVYLNNVQTQNRSILSEASPLEKRSAQLDDQINRSNIVNPITGTVITKYAQQGEITAAGKALYKIADLSVITLRVYFTGDQLSGIKLGQAVKVFTDKGREEYNENPGTITWISDKAEFTPKTIQTKDERANLVYAAKIKMKNDGLLKLGMYAEIKLN